MSDHGNRPAEDDGTELAHLEASWELPALWHCAHCREPITGEGYTWFGPMPLPGQDKLTVPRYHLGRDECREAGGMPPMAPTGHTSA